MIYLYLKTHNKTGLKYLGKTESKNPYKYRGSGKYWKHHIEKHGYDVTTQILLVTEDKNELKETGLFFSRLWNVVKSDDFANLKLEDGHRGGHLESIEFSERMKHSNKERIENGTHHFLNSEVQRNIANSRVKAGTHHFLTLAKERVNAGTHNFQGENNPSIKQVKEGIHLFQNKEWAKERSRKQIEKGTHSGLGKVKCVNHEGNIVQISKDEYYAQIGDKNSWEFVMMLSNEGKRRRKENA